MASLARRLPRAAAPLLRRAAPVVRIPALPRTSGFQTARYSSTKVPAPTKRTNVTLNGRFLSYDNIFLRDACTCPQCVHPSTQQKLFRTSDIPATIAPVSAVTKSDGSLAITWNEAMPHEAGPHTSVYPYEFLMKNKTQRGRIRRAYNDQNQVMWDGAQMKRDNMWVEYSEYMEGDEATLYNAVRQLERYGLLFIRGIPDDSDAVEGIAERLGPIKNTFYGKTWDVKSYPNSKNIAYTSLELGLHMDLLYFESPPGLQFLHCVRNSTTGGESIFVDSFRAAMMVKANSANLFKSLTTFPVTYQYLNDGQYYSYTRPHVVMDPHHYGDNKIAHVNWGPPFQGPFQVNIGESGDPKFRQYIAAVKQFAKHLDDPAAHFELKLAQGECVVFMNRRVLHSRRAFDANSGERWLKGTYVDIDAFDSKYRTLCAKHKHEDEFSYID